MAVTLKDMQASFEQFRNEHAENERMLREDLEVCRSCVRYFASIYSTLMHFIYFRIYFIF